MISSVNPVGLYVHVPFCRRKCPYCDFYSLPGSDDERMDAYLEAILRELRRYASEGLITSADTVYLGGGTPSLLGEKRLNRLLTGISAEIALATNAEITLEANPDSVSAAMLKEIWAGGFNRLSLGVQSVAEPGLRALGRLHDADGARRAVSSAQEAGFVNLSVDLMLGTPYETEETISAFADWVFGQGIPHLSAYLLKREPGTPFETSPLPFPDEDTAADRYLFLCGLMNRAGYRHYEISNFSLPGHESRHNLRYWRCEEYLGLGPSAHSYLSGRRFSVPPDLDGFINKAGQTRWEETFEPGGDPEEVLMLALRLLDGLNLGDHEARFGIPADALRRRAGPFVLAGWAVMSGDVLSLTDEGMLVSNTVIAGLLTP